MNQIQHIVPHARLIQISFPADFRAAFKDKKVDPRMLKAVCESQAAEAATDYFNFQASHLKLENLECR